jgi:hypothetical protein
MRQAENIVRIEGILSEVNIEKGSFQKNGNTLESIGGSIKIKVAEPGREVLEVPVTMFATKLTNAGKPNPAYESIERVLKEYTSIAAAGGEEGADRVRITKASIQMNEYYNDKETLVSFPRISTSFITRIKKEECKPHATFSTEFVVAELGDELDNEGTPTGRYKIRGVLPQYGDKVDVVTFYGESEGVIQAISTYWESGATVKAKGRLNFSSTTEEVIEEVDFGEPTKSVRTINVSELIITGGSQNPLEGEFAYGSDEIKKALAERMARLEESKTKKKKKGNAAPAQKTSGISAEDVGF